MDFLANENFPLSSIGILRFNSVNIKSIASEFSGITDKEVMEIASALLNPVSISLNC
jgi:hypothetical protein